MRDCVSGLPLLLGRVAQHGARGEWQWSDQGWEWSHRKNSDTHPAPSCIREHTDRGQPNLPLNSTAPVKHTMHSFPSTHCSCYGCLRSGAQRQKGTAVSGPRRPSSAAWIGKQQWSELTSPACRWKRLRRPYARRRRGPGSGNVRGNEHKQSRWRLHHPLPQLR
jgi:hypothetical protein